MQMLHYSYTVYCLVCIESYFKTETRKDFEYSRLIIITLLLVE